MKTFGDFMRNKEILAEMGISPDTDKYQTASSRGLDQHLGLTRGEPTPKKKVNGVRIDRPDPSDKAGDEFLKRAEEEAAKRASVQGAVKPKPKNRIVSNPDDKYDKGVDSWIASAQANRLMGRDDVPPPPDSLIDKARHDMSKPLGDNKARKPIPGKSIPSSGDFNQAGGDRAEHDQAVEKIRGELAHYKPGMVLKAILPKAGPNDLDHLLDLYGH